MHGRGSLQPRSVFGQTLVPEPQNVLTDLGGQIRPVSLRARARARVCRKGRGRVSNGSGHRLVALTTTHLAAPENIGVQWWLIVGHPLVYFVDGRPVQVPMAVLGEQVVLIERAAFNSSGRVGDQDTEPPLTFAPPCPVSSPEVSRQSKEMNMPALASITTARRRPPVIRGYGAAALMPHRRGPRAAFPESTSEPNLQQVKREESGCGKERRCFRMV